MVAGETCITVRRPAGVRELRECAMESQRPTSTTVNRRIVLGATAAAAAFGLGAGAAPGAAAPGRSRVTEGDSEIRPFRVDVPEEQLVDLRRRIAATRWSDRETVSDDSQ